MTKLGYVFIAINSLLIYSYSRLAWFLTMPIAIFAVYLLYSAERRSRPRLLRALPQFAAWASQVVNSVLPPKRTPSGDDERTELPGGPDRGDRQAPSTPYSEASEKAYCSRCDAALPRNAMTEVHDDRFTILVCDNCHADDDVPLAN